MPRVYDTYAYLASYRTQDRDVYSVYVHYTCVICNGPLIHLWLGIVRDESIRHLAMPSYHPARSQRLTKKLKSTSRRLAHEGLPGQGAPYGARKRLCLGCFGLSECVHRTCHLAFFYLALTHASNNRDVQNVV